MLLRRILRFYTEGFRRMTWGRALWLLILFKLCVMFCILRPFFFKNYLNREEVGQDKSGYVSGELIERAELVSNDK